ncbi:hypothetical protein FACS1894137_03090 [Spirochaetia bacterium]|nr:hypothetical protein FACS1894137_03090 [Spirochaetia bacterium]
MPKRLSRYSRERNFRQIYYTHDILTQSINISFNDRSFRTAYFLLKSNEEIEQIKKNEIYEIERYTCFDLISSIEAMFRIDFYYRCENKLRDDLSRDFRTIYKWHEKNIKLVDHIFHTWKKYNPNNPNKKLLEELNTIFQYKNVGCGRR